MAAAKLRGVARTLAFLAVTFAVIGGAVLTNPLGRGPRRPLRRAWGRLVAAILGVRLRRAGEPFRACPTLFVANHLSYLDVVCLSTALDATFIAKSEVAGWPLVGYVARLAGTMFVRRHWRLALVQRDALAARLRAGESLILFGEGTSTDGLDVKPFKTSLLSVAEPWVLDRPVGVQSVSLVYLRLSDGTPIDAANVHLYSWWGSADMAPHLWRVLCLGGAEIEVHFGPPVLSWAVTSRKLLGPALRGEVVARLEGSRARVRREQEPAASGDPATALR